MHQFSELELPTVYVFSGAGLSAASGLHTYRDKEGIWTQYDPMKVCHYPTFKEYRTETFEFMNKMLAHVEQAQPNLAHQALAQLQAEFPQQVVNLTQNVDDLLERAGCQEVVHLHGHLKGYNCTACGFEWRREAPTYCEHHRCPKCNSLRGVKPSVVMFGEAAPQYAALRKLHRQAKRGDVVLAIGTSFEVLSESDVVPRTLQGSERAIEANLESCADPAYFGTRVQGPAVSTVPHVVRKLRDYLGGHSFSLEI